MEPIVDTRRTNNRRLAAGMIVPLLLLLLLVGKKVSDHDPKPPTPPGAPAPSTKCGDESGFLAMFATGHRFGPPVTATETDKVQAQLHKERCMDSAKLTAHVEYQGRAYTSPEERARRTRELRDNPKLRAQKVKELEAKEATAVKVEVTTMSNKYQTMYMVTEGHDVPWIYATTADRPTFRVLKFTYADGTWDAYKLDCDFQPVATKFPGLPNTPEATPAAPEAPATPSTPHVCPPEMPHGTWPICKDDPSNDPSQQGNVPTGVTGQAPPVNGPASPPAAGTPPPVYNPPEPPTATTIPRGGGGGPTTTIPPNEGGGGVVPPDGGGGPACDPRVCG